MAEAAAAMGDYIRDPEAITRQSFEIVRRETDLEGLPEDVAAIVLRMIHACGMPDIAADVAWRGTPGAAAHAALEAGAPILTDARMVAAGITRARLPADNPVITTLDDPAVPRRAARQGTTRSAAAVDLWTPLLGGAVVAIGNAPTALFRLLELLQEGAQRPAAILAFPVGFVGAAESKDALIAFEPAPPFVTLRGRRGGSPMASAAVNAAASPSPI